MMLLWLLGTLFIAGLLCLVRSQATHWPKVVCCLGFFTALIILSIIYVETDELALKNAGWLMEIRLPWITAWNINFHVGLDSLSFWLSVLAILMGFLAIFIARPKHKAGSYYAAIAWATFGITGLFLSADVFLFFMFWEVALFPIYWTLMVHGGDGRFKATLRFIIFTQGSGLILLLSILGLVLANFNANGILSFDYLELSSQVLPDGLGLLLLVGFLLAFLLKLPAFPLHTWMPAVMSEAPASILLVGIVIKTSIYGLLRFSWPIFPEASSMVAIPMMIVGIVSLIYGAILAFSQNDPKRFLAYSTISHAGMLLIGVFCANKEAYGGVYILLVTQALSTGGILVLLDRLFPLGQNLSMERVQGLWERGPKISSMLLIFLLAGLGFPTFGNFVGEWLILWGVFEYSPLFAALASLGVIFGAVYSLWFFQRLCLGKTKDIEVNFPDDLKKSELMVYGLVAVMLLGLGFFPSAIMQHVSAPFLSSVDEVAADSPDTHF